MGGVTHRWRWKSESISRNEERKGEEILTLILKSPNSRIELDSKEILARRSPTLLRICQGHQKEGDK